MSTFFIQNRLFFLSKTLCHSILNGLLFDSKWAVIKRINTLL